ncbi:MAG: ATP-binding protein [Bacteroidetes bacterium HGW-Bacteroidetes-9]|jgi:Holliday junction resolvase-like predicted endonuclease|nr:MAG: ATP-binding protein [Bacteroidetes bacterium HGW-Bacteroidetes-9]
MPDKYLIQKSSGEKQHYSVEKLHNSLRLAGASKETISFIISEIEKDLSGGITTRNIYKKAFRLLRQKQHSIAARYSLKNAIMELGPTGYPFEKFVGELFKMQGFKVEVGIIVDGRCVTHEVDVVARTKKLTIMVECKYHNTAGKICNIQVPLYIKSRFDDIRTVLMKQPQENNKTFEGWVVTNTRFSGDAEQYGRCAGLHLVGWDYPQIGSLKNLIENTGLFPVTALAGLNKRQKQQLIDNDIILCRDLQNNPELIELLHLPPKVASRVMTEVRELCG